jgi:FlaA1/EpsC-like NDP-sugar epimerase
MNKTILIIGGTGTIGSYLAKAYSTDNHVVVYSRNEQTQVLMSKQLPNVEYVIGDLKDKLSIKGALLKYKPDIIINTAALKHIDVCERNPVESINTNVIANINLIDVLRELPKSEAPSHLIFISTDKACNPSGVYGLCKLLSEKLYLDFAKEKNNPINVNVARFGNIFNSSGSIIPILMSKITAGATELEITDGNMTRFMVPLPLVKKVISWITSQTEVDGKVVITYTKSIRLKDLVFNLCSRSDESIMVKEVGARPAEKMHEDLVPKEDWSTDTLFQEKYHVLDAPSSLSYEMFSSEHQVMTVSELDDFMKEHYAPTI